MHWPSTKSEQQRLSDSAPSRNIVPIGGSRAGMRRRLRRRHLVAAVVAASVGLAALGGVGHTLAEASPDSLPGNCNLSPGEEFPDICPSLPSNTVDNGGEPYLEVLNDGTRRYRFDAVLWNEGGAFELEGRNCTSTLCSELIQRTWTGGEPGGSSQAREHDIPGRNLAATPNARSWTR
jgi:hypothetical protein